MWRFRAVLGGWSSGPSAKVQGTPGGALGPWESSPASGLVSDPTSVFPIFSELKLFLPVSAGFWDS